MTAERDPGMDPAPPAWQSPEYAPTFPYAPPSETPPEDVRDPVGSVHFADADAMHAEMMAELRKQSAPLAKLIALWGMVGWEIVQLDAAVAPVPKSQHIRFRVQRVIVNPVTAGVLTLTIGTATYPFDGAARSLQDVPFPLVIERGSDMSAVGADGRLYLLGIPE